MKFENQNPTPIKQNYTIFFGSLLAAALLLTGTTSFAQERENVTNSAMEDFNKTDRNTNQKLEQEEFNERMSETGLFNTWDIDQDEQLSKEEFEEGYKKGEEQGFTVKEPVIGNHAIVEVNEDDSVNLDGPAQPALNLDRIDDWDLDNDGYYSEAEMNNAFFDVWDLDGDGALDYEEYRTSFLHPENRE